LKIRKTLGKSLQDPLTLLDLIFYCAKLEGQSNGYANFRSLSLQLDALLENCLWDEILKGSLKNSPELRSFIVQSTKDDPLLRPSMTLSPVDTKAALKQLTNNFRKKQQSLPQFDPSFLESTREQIQNTMLYPKKVYLHHQLGASQTVETTSSQMVVQQTSATTETIAADETETVSTHYAWELFLQGKEPLVRSPEIIAHPLSLVFSHPLLQKYQPLFAKTPLFISQNALCTFTGDTLQQPSWVNGYVKPLHYIAQMPDGRYILIDTEEAELILKEPQRVQLLWLVNHGPLILNGQEKQSLEVKQMELYAKLLGRDVEFTDEQQSLLNASFSKADLSLCKEFNVEKFPL
jgi:hypothetical protein